MTTTNTATSDVDHSSWWIDSCSTAHITHDINDLEHPEPHRHPVRTGGGIIYSTHKGTITVNDITLTDVLCVPQFPKKLLSVAILEEQGWDLSLTSTPRSLVKDNIKVAVEKEGRLYRLQSTEAYYTDMDWHGRYGYPPLQGILLYPRSSSIAARLSATMRTMHKGKMAKPISHSRTTKVGEHLHSDLCGPLPTQDMHQKQYMPILVDDFSRFTMTRAIRGKSENQRTAFGRMAGATSTPTTGSRRATQNTEIYCWKGTTPAHRGPDLATKRHTRRDTPHYDRSSHNSRGSSMGSSKSEN